MGRGNARLISWDGERTITFNMTDALLSPESFSVLSGAGLIDGSEKPITVHQTEQLVVDENDLISVSNKPHVIEGEDYIYVMKLDSNGQVASEPFIYTYNGEEADSESGLYKLALKTENYTADENLAPKSGDVVIVDYYSDKSGSGVYQIDITPDKFGGAYYLEASTLFRDRATGKDMPAEFIIPNCRIQSNFTLRWLPVVILQPSILLWTPSPIILVSIRLKRFLLRFRLSVLTPMKSLLVLRPSLMTF